MAQNKALQINLPGVDRFNLVNCHNSYSKNKGGN